ncbi:MAG TPA: ribbon-helix-helix protein, CopG family [Vicinamibacteria bacterium]|nr:ribbon-helix-helix protein, CopG family [Vicinamibacteria bacterium]
MVRTHIRLTEDQARRLRARARERGVSVAELIRQCVETELAEHTPTRAELYNRAASLVERFAERRGARDLAGKHDDYLDRAFD